MYLDKEKGVNPVLTFCPRCGGDAPELILMGNKGYYQDCPNCGTRTEIFRSGGAEKMACDMGVRFLGRIPIEPAIVESTDVGKLYLAHHAETETARSFRAIAKGIANREGEDEEAS